MAALQAVRVLTATAARVVRGRLARREVDRLMADRPQPVPGTVQVLVHFPDFPVNLYQLRQWYRPLAVLAEQHSVVVMARYATTARDLLRECPLPVVLARSIAEVEEFLTAHPVRAVLYVNQNVRNFSVMRYAEPAHVFMCHGESDKDYMSSNQLKAYDLTLVAGQAAVDRLRRKLVDFDVDTRTARIGRPQADVPGPGPSLPDDARTTVLYAPTWEGDRPTMSYGSATSHGERLVAALLADPRFRVVFRPHPRTGASDPAARAAVARITAMVRAAARHDPASGHLDDRGPDFGWQLDACDVCITDISAVAYDWLATGKPFLVTRPVSPDALVDTEGLIGALDLLPADDAGRAPELVTALLTEPQPALAAMVEHYFGDMTPGASLRRFVEAVHAVVVEREAALGRRAGQTPGS